MKEVFVHDLKDGDTIFVGSIRAKIKRINILGSPSVEIILRDYPRKLYYSFFKQVYKI